MQAAKFLRPQGRKGSLRRLSGKPARKTSGLPCGQADVLVLTTPINGRVMAEGVPLNSYTGLHPDFGQSAVGYPRPEHIHNSRVILVDKLQQKFYDGLVFHAEIAGGAMSHQVP